MVGAAPKREDQPQTLYRCSFCCKTQDRVAKLISGPGVMICNECVDLCVPIMASARSPRPEQMPTPAKAPTDQLLDVLKGYDTAFARVHDMMRGIVDLLREREVSWAAIGETLGVSRQAAWKRFG